MDMLPTNDNTATVELRPPEATVVMDSRNSSLKIKNMSMLLASNTPLYVKKNGGTAGLVSNQKSTEIPPKKNTKKPRYKESEITVKWAESDSIFSVGDKLEFVAPRKGEDKGTLKRKRPNPRMPDAYEVHDAYKIKHDVNRSECFKGLFCVNFYRVTHCGHDHTLTLYEIYDAPDRVLNHYVFEGAVRIPTGPESKTLSEGSDDESCNQNIHNLGHLHGTGGGYSQK